MQRIITKCHINTLLVRETDMTMLRLFVTEEYEALVSNIHQDAKLLTFVWAMKQHSEYLLDVEVKVDDGAGNVLEDALNSSQMRFLKGAMSRALKAGVTNVMHSNPW